MEDSEIASLRIRAALRALRPVYYLVASAGILWFDVWIFYKGWTGPQGFLMGIAFCVAAWPWFERIWK